MNHRSLRRVALLFSQCTRHWQLLTLVACAFCPAIAAGVEQKSTDHSSVSLRRPSLPTTDAANSDEHPVDRWLRPYFTQHNFEPGQVVDDLTFARRVHLDLIGLLPTPEKLAAFCADTNSNKRAALVDELLSNRRAYAEHWLTFWNDALRNEYRGTGFIDGGRKQITEWLYGALYDNKPYDQFVRELISPVEGSEGFTKGIVWRGVVNASQKPQMQAAQHVAQVFLGTNLKCASCHDSFINEWNLSDAYGLATVFADEPLEIFRCDKATGEKSTIQFLYPELGSIDPAASRGERLHQLAALVSSPENGRFARVIVNRLWAVFYGRGIVEPIHDLDGNAWNSDLLDWLAADLVDHDYDLKHTMTLMCTSRAYQFPSVGAPSPSETEFTFHGPIVKRMTAEQFADAVFAISRIERELTADMLKIDGRGQGGQLSAARAVLLARRTPLEAPRPSADGLIASAASDSCCLIGNQLRAALVPSDPLTTALGRPNREQVVLRRDEWATTLQALELTNGVTLDALVQRGAAAWLNDGNVEADELILQLYRVSLGREPSPAELATSRELVGSPSTATGVADLLWAISMLPEFQLLQ